MPLRLPSTLRRRARERGVSWWYLGACSRAVRTSAWEKARGGTAVPMEWRYTVYFFLEKIWVKRVMKDEAKEE